MAERGWMGVEWLLATPVQFGVGAAVGLEGMGQAGDAAGEIHAATLCMGAGPRQVALGTGGITGGAAPGLRPPPRYFRQEEDQERRW